MTDEQNLAKASRIIDTMKTDYQELSTMIANQPKLHVVQQWDVDRELVEGTAPDCDELLSAANAEPAKPRYVCASDYADAVHSLRQKGFTWNEVTAWMSSKGAVFSQQAIIAGYRTKYAP